MGWYLLDSPNPNGRFFHPQRLPCRHGIAVDHLPHLAVIHTAENLPDFDGPDSGAEAVARYAATTTRRVSWHYTVDSDSTIPMLPLTHTAWHVRGFNRCSVGIEIATRHDRWASAPKGWVDGVLDRLRRLTIDLRVDHNIPTVRLAGADPGPTRGYVSHSQLDPTRRRDPGPAFPWDRLLGGGVTDDPPTGIVALRRGDRGPAVRRLQLDLIAVLGPEALPRWGADGTFGAETGAAVLAFQRRMQVDDLGYADAGTIALLAAERSAR